MKFFGGMDLPSSRIVVESLTTFFDAAVVCCAFVIEAVVVLMRRVMVAPVRKIAAIINPTETLF
ncbi:MAG: hypothetical protein WA395_04320 [Nitrososphaeraceae archaeon]|jgi:hypothetical protein